MHDHSHEHDQAEWDHDFGDATPHEQSLFYRSQLLHIATEIYKAGVPPGRTGVRHADWVPDPYHSPEEAVKVAKELMDAADDLIIDCRVVDESEDDES